MPSRSLSPIPMMKTAPCSRQMAFSRSLGVLFGYFRRSSSLWMKNISSGRNGFSCVYVSQM